MEIYNQINEIDVDEVGVGGAKNFFEAKVNILAQKLVSRKVNLGI